MDRSCGLLKEWMDFDQVKLGYIILCVCMWGRGDFKSHVLLDKENCTVFRKQICALQSL